MLVLGACWCGAMARAQQPLVLEPASTQRPSALSEHVRIEHVSARTSVRVGEQFRTTLRIAIDDAWLRERALQLFSRPLAVPVQVQARWIGGQPGLASLARDPAAGGAFALGEAIVGFDRSESRTSDGRDWTVHEHELSWRASVDGTIVFEAPTLRVAWSERWRDDAFQGRVPLDRRDELLQGETLRIEARAVPEEGRPLDWGGAVGRCTTRAQLARDEIKLGESAQLVYAVAGECDLDSLRVEMPRELAGLRLAGERSERRGAERVWMFDLQPLAAGDMLVTAPALAWFDPETDAWRVEAAIPLALRVTGSAAGAAAAGSPPENRAAEQARELRLVVLALAAAIVAAAFFLLRRARRRPVKSP